MEELEPELAQDLLLLATGIEQYRWKDKRRAALAIVEILGSHTLAIIQAGAFIKKKLCTIEQYPAIFQQQKGQLLKFYSKQNASIYRNVYATFDVSAKYLEKSKLPEALDAVNLLHILAFFYNSEISEVIFLRAAQYASQIRDEDLDDQGKIYSLSTNHISRFPEYAQGQSDLQNRLRWRKACSVLESLSIIVIRAEDVDDDEEHSSFTVSMHSLIHVWAKERQDFQSQSKAWQSASTVIAFSCQGWYGYCPFFMLLQPHVRACVNHSIEGYTQQISEMETAQILFQLAHVLYTMRDDRSLDSLISQTRSRLQDTTEEDIIIEIDIFTGRVLEQQGDYGTAVQIYKAVTKRQTLALTDDHPDRLASQRALAGAYEANGQVEEAVQLLKHVVQVEEKLADDHPDRLASQRALAGVYEANGQVEEAVQLLEHVVQVEEKLADDHPDRLASQHALALAYEANGQIEETVQLLEHVVQVQEKLAHDHPSRLASQHALAVAYRANGQIEEAVQLLEHVVQVQEKLADNHSSRLASQHALALAYQANGQIEEAVQLLEHVVQVKEKLADNHPSRLASQHVLAGAYQASGQVEEAVQLLEHVVQVEEKLADDHPSRLASQHALAMAYQANGQIEEAVQLLKHVVQVEEKLIDDHPDRLASKHALVNAYQANGQIKEAVQLLEHVVQVEEKLADDHPSRLVSQRDLANAYRANGQVEEAVQLLEYVVHIQEKLADNHPSRLASQRDLANAYRANGQVEEAVQVREKLVNNNTQVIE